MELVRFLIITLFGLGLYNIFLSVFKVPKYNSEINSLLKIFRKKESNSTDKYTPFTHYIAERIKLPYGIKTSLEEKLLMADINSTPELYVSNLINKSFTFIIFAIIMIPIHKIISLVLVFNAIQTVLKGYNSLNSEIKIKTEKVEREIPKFLDYMTNSFRYDKNVKQAFESYESIAGDYLKKNITITIADMNTGNYVNALRRLDSRINSYNFSKIIRAIIQVVKGDENIQYLHNLYRESASKEYERLKLESEKKIEKVSKYSKIMLICLVVMAFTMMGMTIYKNIINLN